MRYILPMLALFPDFVYRHRTYVQSTGPLRIIHCDSSQHNCLRYDQIEKRRKIKRKLNRPIWYDNRRTK